MNKEFKVAVSFWQLQAGYLTVYAKDMEEAETIAAKMLERHKDPIVVKTTEVEKPSNIIKLDTPKIITE